MQGFDRTRHADLPRFIVLTEPGRLWIGLDIILLLYPLQGFFIANMRKIGPLFYWYIVERDSLPGREVKRVTGKPSPGGSDGFPYLQIEFLSQPSQFKLAPLDGSTYLTALFLY